MENVTIDTYVMKGYKYTLLVMIYIFAILGLTLFFAIKTNVEIIIWIGMTLIILPGIFANFFRKPFMQAAIFSFKDESLTVSIKGENDIVIMSKEILSFRGIASPKDDSSYLRINFRDNSFVKFTFTKQSKRYLKVPVIDVIFDFIKSYNSKQKEESQKIRVMPSLFARKEGKIYIYIIAAMVLIGIVFQIFLKPITILFSLLGVLIWYLLILVGKKRDVEINKKLTE